MNKIEFYGGGVGALNQYAYCINIVESPKVLMNRMMPFLHTEEQKKWKKGGNIHAFLNRTTTKRN